MVFGFVNSTSSSMVFFVLGTPNGEFTTEELGDSLARDCALS
jgi:hypothetical protein